jgi:NADH dehydrogenase [ubiquinone] 1 alpha subcomplex assembly factor 7
MPTTSKSPFRLAISREPTPLSQVLPTTSSRFPKLQEGGRVEISQESWKISRKVGQLIGKGGAGLYVDYGGPQMFGNSFRVRPLSSFALKFRNNPKKKERLTSRASGTIR